MFLKIRSFGNLLGERNRSLLLNSFVCQSSYVNVRKRYVIPFTTVVGTEGKAQAT